MARCSTSISTRLHAVVVALEVGDLTLDGWHMFGGNPRHDGPVARADRGYSSSRGAPSTASTASCDGPPGMR